MTRWRRASSGARAGSGWGLLTKGIAGLFALTAAACGGQEYDYHRAERVDVFHQTRQRAVDLLLVVDNSCSMLDEQDHLAASFDALIAALSSGDTDYRVATTTSEPALPQYRARLSGGTDEIVVVAPDGITEIDRVAYDDLTWPISQGVALERCDPTLPGTDPAAWRAAVDPPGAPNTCAPASVIGTDRGARPPEPGDLWVDRFLAWPLGDTACEWVGLLNRTADTLDLSGFVVRDDGRDSAVLPAGSRIAPGDTLVLGRSADPAVNCGTPVDVVLTGFGLAQGERWIDRDTANAPEVFSELVAVGTGGFGLEMGMENARLALSNPVNLATTGGFLRDDADLALLFFSDEDDLSPSSVDAYVDAFRALKGDAGYREPGRVRIGAAVGTDPAGIDCAEAVYAERYMALVGATDGLAWSICDDLSHVADQAGVTFSEQVLAFQLSDLPAVDTLVAKHYATEDEASYLGDLVRDVDFTLSVSEDDAGVDAVWLTFPEDRIPPGHYVVVHYEVVPDSAQIDLGATTAAVTP